MTQNTKDETQWAQDIISFSEDIPMRIGSNAVFQQLPSMFSECAKTPLAQRIIDESAISKIDGAVTSITPDVAENLLTGMHTFISSAFDSIHSGKGGPAELKRLRDHSRDHLELYQQHRPLLRCILPLVEHEAWETQTSNAIPLHLLLKYTPAWRLFILAWLYRDLSCRSENLFEHESPPAPIAAFDLRGLTITSCRFGDKTCFFGPHYRARKAISRKTFYGQHSEIFLDCFNFLHRAYADQHFTCPLTPLSLTQVVGKSSIYPEDIFHEKAKRAADSLISLEDYIKSGRNRDEVSSVSVAATYLAKNKLAGEDAQNIHFCAYPSSPTSVLVTAMQTARGIRFQTQKSKEVAEAGAFLSDGKRSKHYERFLEHTQGIKLKIRQCNSVRLSILYSWIDRQFSAIDRLAAQSSSIYMYATHRGYEHQICGAIAEMFRADTCTLWGANYASLGRLEIVGDHALNPDLMQRTEEKQHALHDSFNRLLMAPHSNIDSADYRVVQSLRPENIADTRNAESLARELTRSGLPEIRSAVIYPVLSIGRLLGVLEANGLEPEQFRWVQQHELQDVASYLGNHMHREQMFRSLHEMSGAILKDEIVYRKSGLGLPRSVGDTICKSICQIFLAAGANLWIQDRRNRRKYTLSGSSIDSNYFESLSKDYKGKVVVMVDDSDPISAPLFSAHNGRSPVYAAYDPARTVSDLADRSAMLLGGDFVEANPLRWVLFETIGFREVYCIPVTDDDSESRPIAYLTLHSFYAHGYTDSWLSIVEIVQRFLLADLNRVYFDQNEQDRRVRFVQHEIRHDAKTIARQGDSLVKRQHYANTTRPKLGRLDREISSLLNLSSEKVAQETRQTLQKVIASLDEKKKLSSQDVAKAIAQMVTLNAELRSSVSSLIRTEGLSSSVLEEMSQTIESLERKISLLESSRTLNINAMFGMGDSLKLAAEKVELRKELTALTSHLRFPEKHRVSVSNRVSSDICLMLIPGPFRQVLKNVVENAYKYCSQDSVFEIEWQSHALVGDWKLILENDGPSLDDGFDPFEIEARGRYAEENNIEGEGYGLYVAQAACKVLGIWIDYHEVLDKRRPGISKHRVTIGGPKHVVI